MAAQSADGYCAWLGHRIHRRHKFSNYLLFGVDDLQQINDPKLKDDGRGATAAKP